MSESNIQRLIVTLCEKVENIETRHVNLLISLETCSLGISGDHGKIFVTSWTSMIYILDPKGSVEEGY